MDNLISGLLATILFVAFVGGLAESIGAAPFIVIVAGVIALLLIDYVQSARQGLKSRKTDKA